MKKLYLTYEEQFEDILNNEEIDRIENLELREIRSKYWALKHKDFINEKEIPDNQLQEVTNKINLAEKKELEDFKRKMKWE